MVRRKSKLIVKIEKGKEVYFKICTNEDCPYNGEPQPLENFSPKKTGVAGRDSRCKTCKAAYQRENKVQFNEYKRKKYYENREKEIKRSLEYQRKNPEKAREYHQRWRKKNADRINANRRIRYKNDSEFRNRILEVTKNFHKQNPEGITRRFHRRRALEMALPSNWTVEIIKSVEKEFNSSCALTGNRKFQWDHFIPISWGHGGTTQMNMVPLSEELNYSKSKMNPFKWAKRKMSQNSFPKEKWNKLVSYLAELHGLNESEFECYVNWCEKNKRSHKQVSLDPRMSVDIWKDLNMIKSRRFYKEEDLQSLYCDGFIGKDKGGYFTYELQYIAQVIKGEKYYIEEMYTYLEKKISMLKGLQLLKKNSSIEYILIDYVLYLLLSLHHNSTIFEPIDDNEIFLSPLQVDEYLQTQFTVRFAMEYAERESYVLKYPICEADLEQIWLLLHFQGGKGRCATGS